MILNPKQDVVYGPVNSRRLGASLGINILPGGRKVCTFNCMYCQYGWTPTDCLSGLNRESFPSINQIVNDVETALLNLPEPPQYLTFSGNGEATLHPDFPEIVNAIIELRDRLRPGCRTAILSNSTPTSNTDVLTALRRLDFRIMKLDVGTDSGLKIYNQPISKLTIDDITDWLCTLGNVTIQSLFSEGSDGNTEEMELSSWENRIKQISPLSVQIYTLKRGYPSRNIGPANIEMLDSIRDRIIKKGITATVYR